MINDFAKALRDSHDIDSYGGAVVVVSNQIAIHAVFNAQRSVH